MVSFADILNNNESLKDAGSGLTAVFVGGTNGIGRSAVEALTKHTDSPTIYMVGRDASRLEKQITTLQKTNTSATFIPVIAADLTLVSNAKRAAEQIAKSANKIDLLILSQGYLSGTREETAEGLDKVTVLRHYSRACFVATLLPQLRAAPNPRVVSVLAGGQEGTLWVDDWELKSHYGLINAAGAGASMQTLFMEHAAKQPENEKIVFIHLFPGAVGGTTLQLTNVPWVLDLLLNYVVLPIWNMFGYSVQEAGERVLFAATSGRFRKLKPGSSVDGHLVQKGSNGQVGSGVYLVQGNSEVVTGGKVLTQLREQNMAEKVWDHTIQVFERV